MVHDERMKGQSLQLLVRQGLQPVTIVLGLQLVVDSAHFLQFLIRERE